MEESRKQFEAWWGDEAQNELRASCAPGWAYRIWQASRAAIEIELPELEKWRSVEPVRAQITYRSMTKDRLIAAGLTVKGDSK